jgi:NadR type nicotinamide-nucleotide adenylyltransferase
MPSPVKIVVIGPESTGKSSLSQALAESLKTVWVKEYAREYLEGIDHPYTEEDLLAIAKGQLASEQALLERANNYLICDTDLYVLKVWSEARYGRCHRQILEEIGSRPYHLYLLTYIDVPWTPDPQREHPAHRDREYFYHLYRDIVQQSGVPWIDIRGTEAERLDAALCAIKNVSG